jgi:class 3 adenylate cyclase/TolB-like protein
MTGIDSDIAGFAGRRTRRALAVVDMVESVRLMQVHELDVIARWRAFVEQVRTVILPACEGRLVKSLGDGMLLDFDDVSCALKAGWRMHASIAGLNGDRDSSACMALRIGIHVADVVVDDLDIYGAGVNVAARIAGLGQPGQTLLSLAAREQLADGVHARLTDLGARFVKHIEEPLRTYLAEPAPGAGAIVASRLPAARDLRPAVAVIPFSCMPADPAFDALGHAMADDMIAAMARHPGLRVLSRASTGVLQRGAPLAPAELQRVLGASFLLSGRYYVHGDRVRVSLELCRLPDAEVLWAGNAGATVQQIFAGEDDLVPHVVAQVGRTILADELRRVRSLPMETLSSYTLFLGASGLMNSLQAGEFRRAREVLDHLVERYPRQAAPYAMLARWYVFKSVQGWSGDRHADSREALECAERSLAIDPDQAIALSAAGAVHMTYNEDAGTALALYQAATAADPLEAHAWACQTAVHSFAGRHDEARACAQRAIAVSPLDPNLFFFESWAAMADLGAARFDEAVGHAQASVRLHALHAPSLRLLIGALWLAGRQADGQAAAERYVQLQPGARAGGPMRALGGPQSVWNGSFTDALRAAGLPP